MTSAIDGLISGLDTTSLISNLMSLEAAPQTALKSKQSTSQTLITAFQSLNTKVASLASAATTAAKASSWSAFTATSSAPSASASAGTTAQAGSISFSVDAVATAQVSLTDKVQDNGSLVPSSPPSVTVKKADGTFITVQPTTGSLADVAQAINDAADAGVHATVVRVSTGAGAEYRIQFTGSTTGQAGKFSVFAGTQAEVEAAAAADTLAGNTDASDALQIDKTPVRTAQDAQITLWKGVVGAEQTFSQSSNTFTGLMTGVDVTVSAVTAADADPVTITIAPNGTALSKLASDLVANLSTVLSEITSRTKTSTTTDSSGRTIVAGGLFAGQGSIRTLQQQVLGAASSPVNGFSPSDVGIVIGSDGTFTFDAAKFAATLAADPAKAQAMVSQLADRVAGVATAASDPTTGVISVKVTGQQTLVKDYADQIENWDRRLALRRTALQKTYAALEVSLSNLNAQSSWLTSQLDSLSSSSK